MACTSIAAASDSSTWVSSSGEVLSMQEETELSVREKRRQFRDSICGAKLSVPSGPAPRAQPWPVLVLLGNKYSTVRMFSALTNCQKPLLFHSPQDAQAPLLAACA